MTQPLTEPNTDVESDSARKRGFAATDLALVAAFAALIGALSYIGAVPVGGVGVPITLQTLGVALAGAVLGPWRGFASVTLYLAMGAVGLPVFAEHSSGLGVFTSVSAGYLIAFPFAAALIGFLVKYVVGTRRTRALILVPAVAAGSILVIHPAGILGMMIHQGVGFDVALAWDIPFWLGDLVKISLVSIIAAEVHRAFPNLLARS